MLCFKPQNDLLWVYIFTLIFSNSKWYFICLKFAWKRVNIGPVEQGPASHISEIQNNNDKLIWTSDIQTDCKLSSLMIL